MTNLKSQPQIMALDIGTKRVGVAVASYDALLPRPLVTLNNDDQLIDNLKEIIQDEQVDRIVFGLPRGLDGQSTKQTEAVRVHAKQIAAYLGLENYFQDEALSSMRAEAQLTDRGKIYTKADIDKLAARQILEDYIAEQL